MMKKLITLILVMSCGLLSLPTVAAPFTVFAQGNSTTGGTGLNTGLNINVGDRLVVSVAGNDCWSAGPGNRIANADGLVLVPSVCQSAPWNSGEWTQGGLTAPYVSLVGSLNNGTTFFLLGTSFDQIMADAGALSLWFFDSNNGDNFGDIVANVRVNPGQGNVPEPGTMILLAIGLGLIAIRSKKLLALIPVR